LLKTDVPEEEKVSRLFQRFLMRRPTTDEVSQGVSVVKRAATGWEDLQWLLVNKVEFVHNF
jgi:hypothetical protein